ncbi:YheC/YheD family protein [Pasteuria penetrans]|uniref:YheC/YheD family endospore coat-associated protein n=1 Tax=Pasteuria penetrans TaxID=86005 RepID=UPI000FBB8A22|nr:YheC/YheD family protein [Pasteuria penetrans]
MGLAKVQVEVVATTLHGEGKYILLNTLTTQKLGKIPAIISISYGSLVSLATVRKQPSFPTHKLGISTALAASLKVQKDSIFHAHFDPKASHIRLGPLLGILFHESTKKPFEPPFGTSEDFLIECAKTGKKTGLQVAILTTQRLDPSRGQTQGWILANREWLPVTLPLPDIIYNRIAPRHAELRERIQKLLHILRDEYSIPIFNECFLSKQQVYEQLRQNRHTRPLLPETIPFTKPNLLRMLRRHSILYLKPNHGSCGYGILRVLRAPSRQWICQRTLPNGIHNHTAPSATNLLRFIRNNIKKRPYLIQKGLQLAQCEGRPFDLRVLVQKDGRGSWCTTSSVARVAGPQQFVSNVSRGGTIRRTTEVISQLSLPPHNHSHVWHHLALQVAQAFEEQITGHYAELGIDLGIDIHGKWWLIEVNSKPSKGEGTLPNSDALSSNAPRPSVRRLLAYTLYLAGMAAKEGGHEKYGTTPESQ